LEQVVGIAKSDGTPVSKIWRYSDLRLVNRPTMRMVRRLL
jgi:hypothetical protein